MSILRDNKTIILGFTGYLGSGCSEVGKYLAFNFTKEIRKEIQDDKFHIVDELYKKLDKASKDNIDEIEGIKRKLKNELEKREILYAIKRNKFELNKDFFYISFSNMIVYFLIKFINNRAANVGRNLQIKSLIEKELKKQGFELEQASELINYFNQITKRVKVKKSLANVDDYTMRIDPEKVKQIKDLFAHFWEVRNAIVSFTGRKILQDYGDNIRRRGNPFLDEKKGEKMDYKKSRYLAWIIDKYITLLAMTGERYFVIECFKDAQEFFYFREKYAYFYLFALDTNRDVRKRRANVDDYDSIEEREKGEQNDAKEFYKLNIPRCLDLADVIIKNNDEFRDLFWKLLKYFALILEPGCIKPSQQETLMNLAYTLSVKSNCISRQVGAIVTNKEGYIIGAGWNDVGEGQISCGLKTSHDHKKIDYLKDDGLDLSKLEDSDYVCFRKCFKNNGSLMHCLALHGEENAILQLAKNHSDIPVNGTIYTTTYPCPLCLKKISQVGIDRIVYTETYSNPISSKILVETTKHIRMESFEGVKYYSYFKLFKPYYDRKEQQSILRCSL